MVLTKNMIKNIHELEVKLTQSLRERNRQRDQRHITLHTLQKEINDLRVRLKQLEEDVAYKQKD